MDWTSLISQTRPISESAIIPYTEFEFARKCRAMGDKIIEKNGQFWRETHPGFYQALHWLARIPAAKAIRPTSFCWGYRATLAEEDASAANGTMPVHLLRDISKYDMNYLTAKRRNALRKSRNSVTVVELTGPAMLNDRGYEVFRSSAIRTGYSSIPTRKVYLGTVAQNFMVQTLALAGLVRNSLAGYLIGHAVGSTAYMDSLILATEHLSTQIGTALVYDFVQICRRSDAIHEIVYGQHSREDQSLVAYKEGMGFPVVYLPSMVYIHPFVEAILRRYKPHVYYRLTGRG